jgi:hypothetical protein
MMRHRIDYGRKRNANDIHATRAGSFLETVPEFWHGAGAAPKECDCLAGLAEPHVVPEYAADSVVVEAAQESDTLPLQGTKGSGFAVCMLDLELKSVGFAPVGDLFVDAYLYQRM